MTKYHHLPLSAIREQYQQGLSFQKIGEQYGVSQQTIGRLLSSSGVQIRQEKEVPIDLIGSLYESGLSTADIGKQVGVSPQTIQRRLKSAGKHRKRHAGEWAKGVPPIPLDEDYLRECANRQMSTREIAATLGVSEECVRNRMIKLGIPRLAAKARPEHNYFWKGGNPTYDDDGYILVKCADHPYARKNGYVCLHRLVMEEKLGRYLLPHEVVHHRNDDKSDNHPDNLELFENNSTHLQETLKGKVPRWTPEGRERIRLGHPSLKKKASSIPAESENDEN